MLRRATRTIADRALTSTSTSSTRGHRGQRVHASSKAGFVKDGKHQYDKKASTTTTTTKTASAGETVEMEELSVFRAIGGLVAAAAGGTLVFALGAGAVTGVASTLAGALGRTVRAKDAMREREALERELEGVNGWGFGARRRRREIRERLDALAEEETA